MKNGLKMVQGETQDSRQWTIDSAKSFLSSTICPPTLTHQEFLEQRRLVFHTQGTWGT